MTAHQVAADSIRLGPQHFVELVEIFRPLLVPLLMVVGLLLLLSVLIRPLIHRPDATLRTAAEVSRKGPAGQVLVGMGMGMGTVVGMIVVKGRAGGVMLMLLVGMAVMAVMIAVSCGSRHHLLVPEHVEINGLIPSHNGVSGHPLPPALGDAAGAFGSA